MQGARDVEDFENDGFFNFFQIVQKKAKEQNSVFFFECEEGNEGEVNGVKCMDFTGWLIPQEKVPVFEALYDARSENVEDDEWDRYSVGTSWRDNNGQIEITFQDLYPFILMCKQDSLKFTEAKNAQL